MKKLDMCVIKYKSDLLNFYKVANRLIVFWIQFIYLLYEFDVIYVAPNFFYKNTLIAVKKYILYNLL